MQQLSLTCQVLIAALITGIFDDIAALGKGEWVADSALAHFRGYDLDNTRRLLTTLAGIKLLDRGNQLHGRGEGSYN